MESSYTTLKQETRCINNTCRLPHMEVKHKLCTCARLTGDVRWYDYVSNNEVVSSHGLIHHPQTKAWIIRSLCQTRWWCPSKPDPSYRLRSSRWCPAITQLEACLKPTSHHLDSADLPGHGKTSDQRSGAGRRQIVLATNCNSGMLWLNASHHDDDVGRAVVI